MKTESAPDHIRQFFLEENPNPERVGCPPEKTLQAAAENRLPVNDPARLHLANCSECFAEYRGYRIDWENRQATERRFIGWGIAAALVIGIAGAVVALRHHSVGPQARQQIAINTPPSTVTGPSRADVPVTPAPKQADSAKPKPPEPRPPRQPPSSIQPNQIPAPTPANDTGKLLPALLDLSGDFPSGAPPARKLSFSLAASNLKLRVLLPAEAETGPYTLRLAENPDGRGVVASTTGEANEHDGTVSLEVTLLLKGKKPGTDYLFVENKSTGKQSVYEVHLTANQAP